MASSIERRWAYQEFAGLGVIPEGYDPAGATELAPQVASEIRRAQYDYNRELVRAFQRAAGSEQDTLYGPYTVSAVAFYGVEDPPAHLFKVGNEIPPYRPPSDEVVIDVPVGPEVGPPEVGEGGVVRAGFDYLGAIIALSSMITVGAASFRGRY